MTDTTSATSTVTAPTATTSFLQWLEGDVIAVVQDIEAGFEVVAEDITGALTWLGSHINDIASTVVAVQSVETQLNAAGIQIPPALANGITAINNAVSGVNAALTGNAINANSSQAVQLGYQAAKTLQIAAAGAAQIAASIKATTATSSAVPAATS
jgi:hypothetical protein